MIKVKNEHSLRALKDIDENEIYICEKEHSAFTYDKEKGWVKTEMPTTDVDMNLYALNQQLIEQLPDLSVEDINNKIQYMNTEFLAKTKNQYYMLYGQSLNYFTLFKCGMFLGSKSSFGLDVIDCLQSVGAIKSIDPTEDGIALEIWVKTQDKGCHSLYLFGYDNGVIECQ